MPDGKTSRRSPQARHSAARSGKKAAPGLQMVAVQSIACAALLLVTLLLKLAGGDAFAQLRTSFEQAVMDNSVMATIAALFDTGEPDEQQLGGAAASSSSQSTSTTTSAGTSAASTASTTGETNGQTAGTQKTGEEPAVVSVGKVLVEAPTGSSFVRLRTNLVARLPVDSGVLTSGYGYRENPTGEGTQFHSGVDIAADGGEPIYAMFFGVVVDAGSSASYGNYIRLYHGGGLEVLYAHCSKVTAEIGDAVKAGSKVALVGDTGDATGNHVHIEAFQDEVRYDPTGIVPVEAYV